jgi:hypothetical protein
MVGKLLLVLLLRIDMMMVCEACGRIVIDKMMVCEACGRIVGGAWGIRWCHGFHRSTELRFENLILVLYFLNQLQVRLEKH